MASCATATDLFRDQHEELFGNFSASAFTMFQVARSCVQPKQLRLLFLCLSTQSSDFASHTHSGDAWASEVARELWRDNGKINIPIALFFVSFVLLVGIVLMNGISAYT